MKKLLLFTMIMLFGLNTFATVDAMTSGWIVVQDFNDESFYLQQVPIIGCYGVSQGPQLTQFTSEYKVKDSLGCGWDSPYMTDINALSCAELVSSEESKDYMSFKKITLDISNCEHKNNARYITLIRTAAKRNFPQTKNGKVDPSKEVELILIK